MNGTDSEQGLRHRPLAYGHIQEIRDGRCYQYVNPSTLVVK